MSTEVQFNLYDFSEETLDFLYNLPSTFPPATHSHSVTDIIDLTLPDLTGGTYDLNVDSVEANSITSNTSLEALNATINGTLTASDIQGNLTGSVRVTVRSGQQLLKGDPVYVSGTFGTGSTAIPIVSRADASNAAKMPAIGIMDADLDNATNGHMIISGRISGFNTNAYNINTKLYVAAGGGLTATPPTARAQAIARVELKDTNHGSVILMAANEDNVTSSTTSDGTAQLDIASLGFNTASGLTAGVGHFVWNDQDGTLDLGLKGGNVTLQLGQESVTRVVNDTGADLLESQYRAVRITGAQGNRLKVKLAQANNDANSVDTLGLVTENIDNNQEGFVTTSGLVRGINTTGSLQGETGINAWEDGDVLYLSPTTPGVLTKIKPQAPNHTIVVGFVVRAHITQGKIYVKVDNGYEIDELHNVKIIDVADKDVLTYNSSTQVWENSSDLRLDSLLINSNNTGLAKLFVESSGENAIGVSVNDASSGVESYSSDGFGVWGSSETSSGVFASSVSGTALIADTDSGSYCAEFSQLGNIRSAIDAVRGWFVWVYGLFTGTLKTANITANREWTLPNKSGTILLDSDLGTGISTFLATPTSTNLRSAITDETGTGSLVFADFPTIKPSQQTITNIFTAATDFQAPPVAIFDDFYGIGGFGQNTTSSYAWDMVRTSGRGSASQGNGLAGDGNNIYHMGIVRLITGTNLDDVVALRLYMGNNQIFYGGTVFKADFAMPVITNVVVNIGMGNGSANMYSLVFDTTISTTAWQFQAGAAASYVSLAGLGIPTPQAGDFKSGTKYRVTISPVNTTTAYLKLESTAWNSASWTTLHDANITHASFVNSNWGMCSPRLFVQNKEATIAALTKDLMCDWVALKMTQIQR